VLAEQGLDGLEKNSVTTTEAQTAAFFRLLYDRGGNAGIDENHLLCIWSLPSKASRFFADIDQAVAYAQTLSGKENAYFGVCPLRHKVRGGRGCKNDVAAVYTTWVDVDVLDQAHKKRNLPVDIAAARSLVAEMDLPPSATILSGHGLQCFWRLKEPIIIASPEDVAKAEALTAGWVGKLKAIAAVHGLDVDAVGDVSRVLRIPNTVNLKGATPQPVLLELPPDIVEYGHDAFTGLQLPEAAPKPPRPAQANLGGQTPLLDAPTGTLKLDRAAEPPHTKWEALCENDLKFKNSWLRKRKDLQDQSPSAYDMSLAILAGQVGWTDQEIANLLIAHRRKHGDDLKFDRKDNYYARTIRKARLAIDMQTDDAAAEAIGGAEVADAAAGGRDAILKSLRGKMKIPLLGVIKRGCPDARYAIIVDVDGPREVAVGDVDMFFSPVDFQHIVFDATNLLIPSLKKDTWQKCIGMMTSIMEEVAIEEGKPRETLIAWIEGYLNDRTAWSGDNWAEALVFRDPFIRHGRLYLHLPAFKRALLMQYGERIDLRDLQATISTAGFSGCRVAGTPESTKTRVGRFYWSIETDKIKDALPEENDE
jgi:hypothetical protein